MTALEGRTAATTSLLLLFLTEWLAFKDGGLQA